MMIYRASSKDATVLSAMGASTFLEAHRESAPAHELSSYMLRVYSEPVISEELRKTENIYHLISIAGEAAGFSKLELDRTDPSIQMKQVSKMDQLYLLPQYHGMKLGAKLLNHNIEYSKQNGEQGMWLVVWTKNSKAIQFYNSFGFSVVDERTFRISTTHQNPCYVMMIKY